MRVQNGHDGFPGMLDMLANDRGRDLKEVLAPNPHTPANPGPGACPGGDPLWSHPRGQAVLAAPQSESVPYHRRVQQTVWVPLTGCGAHAWMVVLWLSSR